MSKVLVIGDSCKDIFIYGDIERIAPEAPVPVIKPRPTYTTENGGMSLNVKSNLEALGVKVDIITNNEEIKKIRYVDHRSNQMVVRIDENDNCAPIKYEDIENIQTNYYDAIIISDYCKGFLNEKHIEQICNHDNVFIDTKKQLGSWIFNAKYIKINDLEYKKNFDIIPSYPELKEKLIITQGKEGCIFQDNIFPVKEVPVRDVSGAGDTFLSALVCEYIKTKDIISSIKFAQECTTKVVQKTGVATP